MSLEKELANDPKLLAVTRHRPPLRRILIGGGSSALLGGAVAFATGNPVENGLAAGAISGLIITDVPDTIRALRVDLHLLNRLVHEIPKRVIKTK